MNIDNKSQGISFFNILICKYGKFYIFSLFVIAIVALLFTFFTGLSLYKITNKYFLLEKQGIQTNAKVINKEEVGFKGGYAYLYYKFTDDQNNLVVGKQEVDKFVYDKTQIGDIIKIRYLKSNSAINGIVNNKAPIIKRAIHMIIPAFVFGLALLVLINLLIKTKKTIFLIKYGTRTKGKVTKKEIKGGAKIYYEFYDDKGVLRSSKSWLPNSELAKQFTIDMPVEVLYDKNNPKNSEIYELIKEFW